MVARFEPVAGLDYEIARRFGVPAIRQALGMLEEAAQRNAPPVKIWVTARDERVRPSHVHTDGQAVPANLRFKVPKVNTGNDVNDVRVGFDLAREPRDPNLPIGNRINCRCTDPSVAHLLAETIHRTDVEHVGNVVRGSVETRFPRAGESEVGTDQDAPSRFMGRALEEVAARLRSGSSR